MSSNGLKRPLECSSDNNSTSNSPINNRNNDSNDEPPTKIQIKTNDSTNYLPTADKYNDLLQEIDELKLRVHYFEEKQNKLIETGDKLPLLTIKYKNERIANTYNKNVLSFLKETFQNNENIVYNISCQFTSIEVFEEKTNKDVEVIEINDESPEQIDEMIIIDNDSDEKVNNESPEQNVNEMIIIDNDEKVNNESTEQNVDEMIIIDNDEKVNSESSEQNVDEMIIIDNGNDEKVNDESLEQIVDEQMIIIDNSNDETVSDMMCLDTTPNLLNDSTDVRYDIKKPNNPKSNSSNNSCFNCGDQGGNKHNLKDCPLPKNWVRINAARKKFKDIQTMNQRYHVADNDDSRFASIKPGGELSKELRHALGLHSKQIPLHVYKMRKLGYPPGWYQELVIQNDTLSMFTDDENGSTIDKSGVIDTSNIVIKDSMIIEYPGFNVPLKKDMKDEYWKYKVPPIQESQFKHNFILFSNQDKNLSSVNANKDSIIDINKDIVDITNDTTDDDDIDERLSVEMEIIPNNDESLPLPIDCTDTNSQDEQSTSNKSKDHEQIDNVNGDSNQESSDSFDNNTSSSTFSNNDNKSKPTLARTPLLSNVSTFKKLPEMDKFSKDMGPLIMFENLSDSVGTYNKMRGLLNKVRTTLKSIHPYPS